MRTHRSIIATFCVFALLPACLAAEDAAPKPAPMHFKLVYRLLQVNGDGKVTSSRSYSTMMEDSASGKGIPSSIRINDRVPFYTSPHRAAENKDGMLQIADTQYQYHDIGTNIDSNDAAVSGRQFSIRVSADVSVVALSNAEMPNIPVIRQLKWNSDVVVTLEKSAIIFSSDDSNDAGKTELELTATQIKEP